MASAEPTPQTPPDVLDRVRGFERPSSTLWSYYVLLSMLLGPFFPLLLIPLFFRYRTLRYRFDDEGVAVRWGVLFRREIHLTYDRVQDIHLVSNAVERWLGLGRIKIQTASGSAKAEMTIEGFAEFELIRDFLYSRMRGQEERSAAGADAASDARVIAELQRATAELEALRRLLAARGGSRDA